MAKSTERPQADGGSLAGDLGPRTIDNSQLFIGRQRARWHQVTSSGVGVPASLWKTKCGWRFANGGTWTLFYSCEPQALKCETCFPLGAQSEDA